MTMTDRCLCKQIDQAQIARTLEEKPADELVLSLSEFFKVFGDPTRLKIIYLLTRHELCVADISTLVGMQQSAVSHQLKILKMSRLVKIRKEGVTTYYSLDDDHVRSLYQIALDHTYEGMAH